MSWCYHTWVDAIIHELMLSYMSWCYHTWVDGNKANQIKCQHRWSCANRRVLHEALIHSESDVVIKDIIQLSHLRPGSFVPQSNRSNSLDLSNSLNQTALHLAVVTNRPGVVSLLVQSGASLHARDLNGDTSLHIACTLRHVHCVRAIIEECRGIQEITDVIATRNYAGMSINTHTYTHTHAHILTHTYTPTYTH